MDEGGYGNAKENVQHDRFGGGRVHVGCGISFHPRTPLQAFQYANLPGTLMLLFSLLWSGAAVKNKQPEVFQHDNARAHTSRATKDFLKLQGINVMN